LIERNRIFIWQNFPIEKSGFKDAIYTFRPEESGTLITRTTTYYSELKPRFYWRLCEYHSIESEHCYVLNDLKKRLELSEMKTEEKTD
jgi:hypothetical protein